MHEKLFEADPNIQYTYAWDRLNEYRQVSKNSFLKILKYAGVEGNLLQFMCGGGLSSSRNERGGERRGDYPVCMLRVGWRGRIMEGEIKSPLPSPLSRAAL